MNTTSPIPSEFGRWSVMAPPRQATNGKVDLVVVSSVATVVHQLLALRGSPSVLNTWPERFITSAASGARKSIGKAAPWVRGWACCSSAYAVRAVYVDSLHVFTGAAAVSRREGLVWGGLAAKLSVSVRECSTDFSPARSARSLAGQYHRRDVL